MNGRAGAVLVAAVVCVGACAAALGATPAGAAAGSPAVHNRTLTPGVTVSVRDLTISGRPEHVTLMSVDLSNRHLQVDAMTPGNGLGAPRRTTSAMVQQNKAIAGINTAFFDLAAKNATPRDGVIRGGHILKTPRRTWDANLYVTSTGLARVGALTFHGTVTRAARGKVAATAREIYGVNSVGDAQKGRIVLITSALVAPDFGASCAVALGTTQGRTRTITRTHASIRSMRRLTSAEFALVSCGKGNTAWLQKQVLPHDRVTTSMAVVGGTPRTLVSGGRKLVHEGKAYDDIDGKVFPGNPRNPETFACASRSGKGLLLGTIDGRQKTSAGVTFAELTRYLLSLHCWSGLVFDGGGSTTIVGRSSTRAAVAVLNRPSGGTQRAIVAGLSVSRR